jgi:hypothetical protein
LGAAVIDDGVESNALPRGTAIAHITDITARAVLLLLGGFLFSRDYRLRC